MLPLAPSVRPAAFGAFPTKTTQKIIHVGYPKTGTVSLSKVIDSFGLSHLHGNLGYKPDDWSVESRTTMEEVLGSVDAWMEMLGRFELDKLLALYPRAKYILTTRDPDAWYRSATRFFEGKMTEDYFVRHFGSADFSDAETWKSSFLAHIEKVKQTIPAGQLLVIDLTSGNSTDNLQNLCQFVEVKECPSGGIPHEHSTDNVLAKQSQSHADQRSRRQAEEVELENFVVVSYPEDSVRSMTEDLPLGLEATHESRFEMSKMLLTKLQAGAVMYMSPDRIPLGNLDAHLEEFRQSGKAFEPFWDANENIVDTGAFLLAPQRVARKSRQVLQTRSWSPFRGWLSVGKLSLGRQTLNTWDFPGSGGALGLFLAGCAVDTAAAFGAGCSAPTLASEVFHQAGFSDWKERRSENFRVIARGAMPGLGLNGPRWVDHWTCMALKYSTGGAKTYSQELGTSSCSTLPRPPLATTTSPPTTTAPMVTTTTAEVTTTTAPPTTTPKVTTTPMVTTTTAEVTTTTAPPTTTPIVTTTTPMVVTTTFEVTTVTAPTTTTLAVTITAVPTTTAPSTTIEATTTIAATTIEAPTTIGMTTIEAPTTTAATTTEAPATIVATTTEAPTTIAATTIEAQRRLE